MDDAGGGGGYAGTYWWNFDVPAMWEVLKNQDTAPHFEVVAGWGLTVDMLLNHYSVVRNYKEQLEQAWPPEKSPASAAYSRRLQTLLDHLWSTYEAAAANYQTLGVVATTIATKRHRLYELHAQWQQHAQAEAVFEALRRSSPETLIPAPDPARRDNLNQQARALMYDLSTTLTAGRTELSEPAPYDPAGYSTRSEGSSGDPAPALFPPDDRAAVLHRGAASGPVLGSVATGPAGSGTVTPGAAGVVSPGSPDAAGELPSSVIIRPGTVPPRTGSAGSPARGGSAFGGSAGSPGGGGSARPVAGVIGGAPRPRATDGVGTPPGSAHPVGGVIGNRGSGTTPESPPGLPPGGRQRGGPTGQRAGRRRGIGARPVERWDPDNPWEVAEGVAPVLQAPPEFTTQDPGPVIGGGPWR